MKNLLSHACNRFYHIGYTYRDGVDNIILHVHVYLLHTGSVCYMLLDTRREGSLNMRDLIRYMYVKELKVNG